MKVTPHDRLFLAALAFEFSLFVAAVLLIRWLGIDQPMIDVRTSQEMLVALAVGVAPLALLWAMLRARSGPLAQVREEGRAMLAELLADHPRGFLGRAALGALALAAGLGEEALFRGALQHGLAPRLGTPGAVVVAAVAFGACHLLSARYFLFATVMGLYFGIMEAWTGLLLGPVLGHFLFDWGALVALRPRPQSSGTVTAGD